MESTPVAAAERTTEPKARTSVFARRLLAEWRRLDLPREEAAVVVAVSGGADSTALLLALDELRKSRRLSLSVFVVHLDHGLREASRADAEWVSELARRHGFGVASKRVDVGAQAEAARDNLEQAARRARYEFFGEAAATCRARFVLLAHTLDDQAETVLLRLLRGSGADGLGGMRTLRPLTDAGETNAQPSVQVARPLLNWARRSDTETYCRARAQEFLRDPMNDDSRFARVRVRGELLPLLRTFNPRVEETLARTAALSRDDAAALDDCAAILLREATHTPRTHADGATTTENSSVRTDGGVPGVDVRVLAAAPPALQRRALRSWLRRARGHLRSLDAVHVEAVRSLLTGERGGRVVELPGGGRVERRAGQLRFIL